MVKRSLADLVSRRREKKRITKVRLAEMTGLTRMAIYRIEAGKSRGRPDTLVALARALALDASVLLNASAPDRSRRRRAAIAK